MCAWMHSCVPTATLHCRAGTVDMRGLTQLSIVTGRLPVHVQQTLRLDAAAGNVSCWAVATLIGVHCIVTVVFLFFLLLQIVECFKQMPELARVAVDPFLPEKSKANIMNSLLKDSGATEITKRLFSEWTLC